MDGWKNRARDRQAGAGEGSFLAGASFPSRLSTPAAMLETVDGAETLAKRRCGAMIADAAQDQDSERL